MSVTATATTARRVPIAARIALVLAGLLAGFDILVSGGELGEHLLQPVALMVLALATLAGIPFAWQARTWARLTVAITRVLSAAAVIPVYFSSDSQGAPQIIGATWIIVSILIAVLMLRTPKS
jgi:hypothetical protein